MCSSRGEPVGVYVGGAAGVYPMFVKGTALRSLLSVIEEQYKADGLARVLAAMPPTLRTKLAPPIQPNTSYPVEVSAALHEAIRTELGKGESTMNFKLGALAARKDFGTIHRAFIRFADYETLLHATERAWARYNSHGRVEWPQIDNGHAIGHIQHVRGFTEPMWQALAGRIFSILELGGAKKPSVTIIEWSEKAVRYELRWE